ncbi:complement C1q tumor necrosis factor-related protein 2-like [Mizuhopecten yessoensis]|uniref:complement C1q tumor necrosis factor-related protein 2-like n=1 Tax=Mizuhopecten yessoensis TaxID=6573 RepID=UPI000B45BA19|nr:complement C1q tumor necrosis factor-related protein 2-like [Mizuhopecten yessoensis]XP_021342910.1 complement C1q tumor necrosis factor-related protein 2-like [Mizuhopecten yessoensis]XP_021342911.1 complement C1q tumor necrosis factor-related protein 2-like [Mizuhopecten yessoensis]XP_021344498.1 complement C1q tumor necrosis factor-related protein 2-like [Mizuhopecten yessoensis]
MMLATMNKFLTNANTNIKVYMLAYLFLLSVKSSLATITYSKASPYCQCCSGPPGTPGGHGNQGLSGPRGMTGFKGQKGEIGNSGIPGPQGPTGKAGDRGRRGRKGLKGECGVRGTKGMRGEVGPYGVMGQKGSKGESGELRRQVAFSASRTSRLGPVLENTIVIYDNVFTNQGDSFDPYTSTFICKVNGTYLFAAHVLCNLDSDAFGWIMMNGNYVIPMHGDQRAGYGTGSNTIILHLVKGDHVWIQLSKNSSLLNDYSTFSGYLLYAD